MQVIQALKMEYEVAQGASVNELERTFVFLLWLLRAELCHDPVELWQVKEDREFPIVAIGLNLNRLQGCHRTLPLHGFKFGFRAGLVEICLNIDHKLVCKDKESSLVHEVSVSLDDESMGLITVRCLHVAVRLEEILPIRG